MNGRKYMILLTEKNYFRQDIKRYEYVLAALQSVGIILLCALLFYDSFLAVPFLVPLGFFYYRQWERDCLERKKQMFLQQFKEAIGALSSALQVGYSAENAWKEAKKDLDILYDSSEPIQREFVYMLRQLQLQISLEKVVDDFARRVEIGEVQDFANVFAIAKKSGGNMLEIIREAIQKLEDKLEVLEEIETVITAKKYEFKIMAVLPLGILAYMKFCFSDFMQILYHNFIGIGGMTVCLAVYIGAYLLGRSIVNIEV